MDQEEQRLREVLTDYALNSKVVDGLESRLQSWATPVELGAAPSGSPLQMSCSLIPSAMQARRNLSSICEEFLRTLPRPPFVVSSMPTDTRTCTHLFTSPSGVIFTAHVHWIFTTDEDGYFMETISLPGVPQPVYSTWKRTAMFSIAEGRWKMCAESFRIA